MSRSFIGVIVMAVLLTLYIILLGQKALLLMLSGVPVGVAIGAALVVMPLVAAWSLWRELSFGARSNRLHQVLLQREPAGQTIPSGRADRAAADANFVLFQAEAEAHPDDWASWFRLGLAYDACGDRRRGRQAIRQAISVSRTTSPPN